MKCFYCQISTKLMEGEIVPNKNVSSDKREKAIAACLDQFCNKGLYETTSRDLSKALKLQSGGMYQYFQTKDEAVIVCAEEAALLLEKYLVKQAIREIQDIDAMFDALMDRADKLSHMMRFLAQVCCVPKYREGIGFLGTLILHPSPKETIFITDSFGLLSEKYLNIKDITAFCVSTLYCFR